MATTADFVMATDTQRGCQEVAQAGVAPESGVLRCRWPRTWLARKPAMAK